LKKSFFYSKDISPEFIKDGVFSAKTVYLILTEIYNSYNPKIYKQLKMQPQYLCFSNLKYNFEFINKLYSLTQEDLFKAIAKIKVYGDQDMNLNNIKKFLQSSYGLNIAANTENHLAKFNFNSTFNELNNVYAKVLEVELKALFGSNVILEKSQENNTYHIHTS
ncbi:MAG: hypothetical protein HON90_12425, partial [Halobacteriovoraceae bacterium]|nr:hypothetical protein [Halobacteriovoraceae bacterium]